MSDPVSVQNPFDNLHSILKTMSIPFNKRGDLKWLARNIAIENSNHPRIDDAEELIKKLLFIKE